MNKKTALYVVVAGVVSLYASFFLRMARANDGPTPLRAALFDTSKSTSSWPEWELVGYPATATDGGTTHEMWWWEFTTSKARRQDERITKLAAMRTGKPGVYHVDITITDRTGGGFHWTGNIAADAPKRTTIAPGWGFILSENPSLTRPPW